MPRSPQLPVLDTDSRPVFAPSPLRALRDEAAVCRVRTPAGDEAWLVTRHAETKALLHDGRLGRFHPSPATAPKYVDSPLVEMLIIDDAEAAREMHRQVRTLLGPQFAARRMRELRPRVAAAARALAADFANREQPADLHRYFALPYSLSILHELIGVPAGERDRAAELLADIGRVGTDEEEAPGPDALFALFRALAESKRAAPRDDVLSRLVAAGVPAEQAAALAATLLMAGLESVASFIALGCVLLARHPERLRSALDDPDAMAALVEEILRNGKQSGSVLPRYAAADIDISGVTIRAGDLVLLDFALANHDERVFERAGEFDPLRTPNPHLSFGHGMWHCLGASLARIELAEAFGALFERMPGLRPAVPDERLVTSAGRLVGGPAQLPVRW
ncbi:cytochrome P450 [Streptomyces afghaniensis]|uniref:cytochrome P450 n=1 Tax=Streptomyces afghaniensis TaxID=66865 RepID=UPI00277DE468|nr:cytochrome P450 [Streptomyces afghaniensis]MDQ1014236.1 cytochrome P450 monooxygenase [Streptomyces afghaniensis]